MYILLPNDLRTGMMSLSPWPVPGAQEDLEDKDSDDKDTSDTIYPTEMITFIHTGTFVHFNRYLKHCSKC